MDRISQAGSSTEKGGQEFPSLHLYLLDDSASDLEALRNISLQVMQSRGISCEIYTFQHPGALESAIARETQYCVCLLDILMYGGRPLGLTLARRLRAKGQQLDIVFTTSSDDYMLEGYDVFALGYLKKPVTAAAFSRIVDHLLSRRGKSCSTLNILSDRVRQSIPLQNICYIDVYGKHCHVHTTKGVLSASMRLKDMMEQLPTDQFLQCHRSYVVNLAHVQSAASDHLQMDNGDRVPIRIRESLSIRQRCAEFLWTEMQEAKT